MRILYIADDGTEFDNEFDCEVYEETNRHNKVNDIEVYDADGNRVLFESVYNDAFYNEAEKIIIHTEEEVADILWLAEYTGWCEFEQITSVGTWVRKNDEEYYEGVWEKVR